MTGAPLNVVSAAAVVLLGTAVGEGIPVLELHGIFGGFDQGLLVALPVLGDSFRIFAPSRFGYLGT